MRIEWICLFFLHFLSLIVSRLRYVALFLHISFSSIDTLSWIIDAWRTKKDTCSNAYVYNFLLPPITRLLFLHIAYRWVKLRVESLKPLVLVEGVKRRRSYHPKDRDNLSGIRPLTNSSVMLHRMKVSLLHCLPWPSILLHLLDPNGDALLHHHRWDGTVAVVADFQLLLLVDGVVVVPVSIQWEHPSFPIDRVVWPNIEWLLPMLRQAGLANLRHRQSESSNVILQQRSFSPILFDGNHPYAFGTGKFDRSTDRDRDEWFWSLRVPSQRSQRLQELLQCPVCFNPYTEPRLLPCGHTYCHECLNRLMQNEHDVVT